MQRGTSKFLFSYDAAGNVVSVKYNGNEYYYVRNGQGDVVKLIDGDGATVVEYTYNTWGKKVTTTGSMAETLGRWQPFRYRGYVYDWETGFYYLQSRYYDPTTGRFISADVLLSTGQGVLGHNCYAYCLGNPVMRADEGGCTSGHVGNLYRTWVETYTGRDVPLTRVKPLERKPDQYYYSSMMYNPDGSVRQIVGDRDGSLTGQMTPILVTTLRGEAGVEFSFSYNVSLYKDANGFSMGAGGGSIGAGFSAGILLIPQTDLEWIKNAKCEAIGGSVGIIGVEYLAFHDGDGNHYETLFFSFGWTATPYMVPLEYHADHQFPL